MANSIDFETKRSIERTRLNSKITQLSSENRSLKHQKDILMRKHVEAKSDWEDKELEMQIKIEKSKVNLSAAERENQKQADNQKVCVCSSEPRG
jgi:hypothetical protein